MIENNNRTTRIGVFYDGAYFAHVSNYYGYHHPRKSRLNISGLHQFIKEKVADLEGVDPRQCSIIDAHYFRGRYSAIEAKNRDKLLQDRLFDDVLMREGVVTHFLPLQKHGRYTTEKGVDVWFALEAFELAIYKKFNVVVLITSDGDYVPLVRKLNTLGTRVMTMAWEFEFVDQNENRQLTTASSVLMNEVAYPVYMNEEIGQSDYSDNPIIEGLFNSVEMNREYMPSSLPKYEHHEPEALGDGTKLEIGKVYEGEIVNMREGYGFISPEDGSPNVFFYHEELVDIDFNDIQVGDLVEFELGKNQKGECAMNIRLINAQEGY